MERRHDEPQPAPLPARICLLCSSHRGDLIDSLVIVFDETGMRRPHLIVLRRMATHRTGSETLAQPAYEWQSDVLIRALPGHTVCELTSKTLLRACSCLSVKLKKMEGVDRKHARFGAALHSR